MAISISPQIRQSQMPASDLQLLTGSSLQVHNSIRTLLQTNTMLEDDGLGDQLTSSLDSLQEAPDNYLEDDLYGHKSQSDGGNAPDFSEMPPADRVSLEEELIRELDNSNLDQNGKVYHLVKGMISDLDANGFLLTTMDLPEKKDIGNTQGFDAKKYSDLFFFKTGRDQTPVDVEKAKTVLKQLGDKVGVSGIGSANTQECLLHQLSQGKSPVHFTAKVILRDHYIDLLKGHDFLDTLRNNYPTSLEYFPEAMSLIEKLNPSPWDRDSSKMNQTHQRGSTFNVNFYEESYETASEHQSPLKLNADKLIVLQQYEDDFKSGKLSENKSKVYSYLKTDYQSALKTIRLLDARKRMQEVILKTIVSKQKEFLQTNDYSKLVPISITELTQSVIDKMKKLLAREEFSVSTSTLRNYLRGNTLQSNHGFYSLRDLVPSTGRVKILQSRSVISDLINKENTITPLSDNAIAGLVKETSDVRLTVNMVTKIRKDLSIPSALVRKARSLVSGMESLSQTAKTIIHETLGKVLNGESPISPYRDATIAILMNKELKGSTLTFRDVKKIREELNIGDQSTRSLVYRKKNQQESIGIESIATPHDAVQIIDTDISLRR